MSEAPGVKAPRCNICEGTEFVEGFNGRMANGIPPTCAGCGTAERHRIVRGLYERLRPVMATWRVLQFSPDRSVEPGWFASYTPSVHGGANSMDMMDTGLPTGSFDLVMSNHVLEHVEDDIAAVRESLRLVGHDGLVHACVPSPGFAWSSEDWGYPDPAKNEHYRLYGADFGFRITSAIGGIGGFAVVGTDDVTSAYDLVFFFSHDSDRLELTGRQLQRSGCPVVRLA